VIVGILMALQRSTALWQMISTLSEINKMVGTLAAPGSKEKENEFVRSVRPVLVDVLDAVL
jgi:hypothetical protein